MHASCNPRCCFCSTQRKHSPSSTAPSQSAAPTRTQAHSLSHPRIPGMIKMKEKATVPKAHSRPTTSRSSVTGVLFSPYRAGAGCWRNALPILILAFLLLQPRVGARTRRTRSSRLQANTVQPFVDRMWAGLRRTTYRPRSFSK